MDMEKNIPFDTTILRDMFSVDNKKVILVKILIYVAERFYIRSSSTWFHHTGRCEAIQIPNIHVEMIWVIYYRGRSFR